MAPPHQSWPHPQVPWPRLHQSWPLPSSRGPSCTSLSPLAGHQSLTSHSKTHPAPSSKEGGLRRGRSVPCFTGTGLEPGCPCLRLGSTRGLGQGLRSARSLRSCDLDSGPLPQPQGRQMRGQEGAGPDRAARGQPTHQTTLCPATPRHLPRPGSAPAPGPAPALEAPQPPQGAKAHLLDVLVVHGVVSHLVAEQLYDLLQLVAVAPPLADDDHLVKQEQVPAQQCGPGPVSSAGARGSEVTRRPQAPGWAAGGLFPPRA